MERLIDELKAVQIKIVIMIADVQLEADHSTTRCGPVSWRHVRGISSIVASLRLKGT
jgi:hypothetical protein